MMVPSLGAAATPIVPSSRDQIGAVPVSGGKGRREDVGDRGRGFDGVDGIRFGDVDPEDVAFDSTDDSSPTARLRSALPTSTSTASPIMWPRDSLTSRNASMFTRRSRNAVSACGGAGLRTKLRSAEEAR